MCSITAFISDQGDFIEITRTVNNSFGQELVQEVNFHIAKEYTEGTYVENIEFCM